MDDYLNDETEGEGTEGALDSVDETELQPYTVESVKQGELSPLELADMLRRSRVTSSQAATDLKKQIEKARNVILQQPTKQSKADWLLGVGSTLLAPGPVGRAGTLGESLSALGKYVGDVTAQERKAKALQAQQLANFDLGVARAQASESKADQAALASMMNKYLAQKPAQATTLEREAAALGMTPQQYLKFRAGLRKKEEPDPDRPSSVVAARVRSTADRNLAPIRAKITSINQAKALINQAYTNPAAVPQVDRYLAKLADSGQISAIEVKNIASAGSLPERIANKVSLLFSGTPTDLSLDDKKKVIDAVEENIASQYNTQHDSLLNTFSSASDISPDAVLKIVGGKYVTEAEKRRRKEAEAPAAPSGGEKIPPAGAIEMLKGNPEKYKSDFDKKYGAGASKKYLGE